VYDLYNSNNNNNNNIGKEEERGCRGGKGWNVKEREMVKIIGGKHGKWRRKNYIISRSSPQSP